MSSSPPTNAIELRGVTKRFATPSGGIYTALRDLDMEVAPGEFCAVVGPTGCGKSTTLTLVSGLEKASAGTVCVDGRPVSGITDGVGFMFQSDAVFPWKSVLDNVAAGPRFRRVGKRRAEEAARDWLRRVGLAGFEDRYPHQLSGGMQQRVVIAMALAKDPSLLILDEPTTHLDADAVIAVLDSVASLPHGPAVVVTTHDPEVARRCGGVVSLREDVCTIAG